MNPKKKKKNLSRFVEASLVPIPDQPAPLGWASLRQSWQGWYRTTLAVATLTANWILWAVSQGPLGREGGSGAMAGMLEL